MNRLGRSAVSVLAVAALILALTVSGCTATDTTDTQAESTDTTALPNTMGGEDMAEIYLAGGCFWGVEKYMAGVQGVIEAESGYANGTTDSPSYRDVTTGRTGYTETVRVVYDPTVAPLPFLLDLFYEAIDPTTLNRQGNDAGTQYRSGIYYTDPADLPVIETSLDKLQERYSKPIVVEARPLTAYTPAEDYHQDYLDKNPAGYCHIGLDLFEKAAQAVPDPSQFPDPASSN